MTALIDRFIALFSQALNNKDIPVLFDERFRQYGTLAERLEHVREFQYHLSQLILRTRDNQTPTSYDFEDAPHLIAKPFEELGIKKELSIWEETMFPSLIESLERHCDLTE